MKKILCLVLCIVTMSTICNNTISAADFTPSIEVTWAYVYSTFEEMLCDSDVVVFGQVIRQECVVKNDGFVYTNSYFEVEESYKGEITGTIIVTQLGGKYNEIETPFPKELPALETNREYILVCYNNNGLFTIAGAGQGVFEDIAFSNWTYVLESCSGSFISYNKKSSSRNVYATPIGGNYYPLNTQGVNYSISGSSNISSDCKEAMIEGFDLWDPYVPFTLNSSSSGIGYYTISVIISSGFYGNDEDSEGILAVTYRPSSTEKIMYFYKAAFVHCGINNAAAWKTIGAHEMGHALGLSHNLYDVQSLMRTDYEDMSPSPQYLDILPLSEIYY